MNIYVYDAFSMMLGYYEGDFVHSGSAFNSTGATRDGITYTKNTHMLTNSYGLYNGNISSQVGAILQSNNTYSTKGDVYQYDLLNRLRSNTDMILSANTWSATSNFANTYSYDANGNIKTLVRAKEDGVVFDELTYVYETNTNKLKQVTDTKGDAVAGYDIDNQTSTTNYTYDAIGNMITDAAEGLTITWLPNGKIATVTKVKGTEDWQLRFQYDAAGRRVAKEKFTGSNYATFSKGTYYVYEAGGKVLATYEKTGEVMKLKEVPLLGSSRLGMDRVDATRSNTPLGTTNIFSRIVGSKGYELTDHLGNVRAVVGDIKLPSGMNFTADLKSSNEYYPFGMAVPTSGYQSAEYRYGYNGKEKDDEVKGEGVQYDYGFRIYDARLAKFLSVDPLTKDYPMLTPYQFASNTPIQAIDLDGLEAWYYQNGTKSSYVGPLSDKARTELRVFTEHELKQLSSNINFSGAIGNAMGNLGVAAVRANYIREQYNGYRELIKSLENDGKLQEASNLRSAIREKFANATPSPFREVREALPSAQSSTKKLGSAARTNASVNESMTAIGKIGVGVTVGAVIYSTVNIATAQDPLLQTQNEITGWGGAYIGMKLGAVSMGEVGSIFGPQGMAIGGTIGGITGGILGGICGQSIFNNVDFRQTRSNLPPQDNLKVSLPIQTTDTQQNVQQSPTNQKPE